MRIISGSYRSRRLRSPTGLANRPTLDRVKEAVFNHLGNISDKCFLDLFCAAGNIGIEALSRGCTKVIFNDIDPLAIRVLRSNLESLKVSSQLYEIFAKDFVEFLSVPGQACDFIYLDPPYDSDHYGEALRLIKKYHWLKPDGEIIAESKKDQQLAELGFRLLKTVNYGQIKITYLG